MSRRHLRALQAALYAASPQAANCHCTQTTSSHGHFAFFGAFGLLVLAAIYQFLPRLKGLTRPAGTRGTWAFWLMVSGMLAMVLSFGVAGVVQTYLWRLVGMDFMIVRLPIYFPPERRPCSRRYLPLLHEACRASS